MTFAGQVCAVTGASSGIGRALALALARGGADVWAIGRSRERLDELSRSGEPGRIAPLPADLAIDEELGSAVVTIRSRRSGLDALIHCAGAITRGQVESSSAEDFDGQYRVNLRVPFLLTRNLLAELKAKRGQIVFVNSSAGYGGAAPDAALYAATKQGLRALADGLRQEVNPDGIRVLSMYPGRTATPMQESVHEHEGRPYRPELLLRPEDVAEMILAALRLPRTAEVTDISIRPMRKLP
jgi:NAD(P)-dependent dehydrogenase (short-subunit alcohol dehydrogenase family)